MSRAHRLPQRRLNPGSPRPGTRRKRLAPQSALPLASGEALAASRSPRETDTWLASSAPSGGTPPSGPVFRRVVHDCVGRLIRWDMKAAQGELRFSDGSRMAIGIDDFLSLGQLVAFTEGQPAQFPDRGPFPLEPPEVGSLVWVNSKTKDLVPERFVSPGKLAPLTWTAPPPSQRVAPQVTRLPGGEVDLTRYRSAAVDRASFRQRIGNVGENPSWTKHGVSLEDASALFHLSTDDHQPINSALWNRDHASLLQWEPLIRCAASALARLESFKGLASRAVFLTPEELAVYVPGAIVPQLGFTSASQRLQFGRDVSMSYRPETERVALVIESRTGRLIRPFSHWFMEDEVLFAPGTQLEVLARGREAGMTGTHTVVYCSDVTA